MSCPATDAAFSAVTGPPVGPWCSLYFSSPRPPKYPGAQRKAREVPERTVFLTTVPVFGRVGIPWTPVWQGVMVIEAWFAAGVWIYTKAARRDLQRDILHHANR